MAYVAVKGGERAIENAHAWLDEARRGDPALLSESARAREQPNTRRPLSESVFEGAFPAG